MTLIEVEPQPRIDTVVRLPDGGEARRTEYVGTVWFDGKPHLSGLMLRRGSCCRLKARSNSKCFDSRPSRRSASSFLCSFFSFLFCSSCCFFLARLL